MRTEVPTSRRLLLVWLSAAVVFGGLLATARAARGPLDDSDPAFQRPGFLDGGPLPAPAARVTDGIPSDGRRSVVFFTRPDRLDRLCHALAARDLGQDVAVAVVVSGTGGACAGGAAIVPDPDGAIADAYGMRRPREGGAPVGYAVVDAAARIRYRTLDPTTVHELSEVRTILGAVS